MLVRMPANQPLLRYYRPPATAIGIDKAVRVRIKRISQAGRGIEPGDGIARLSADRGEIAARQDLAVWLHGDGKDQAGANGLIAFGLNESAKPVVASRRAMIISRLSADEHVGEIAARQDFAIRLHGD